MINKGINNTINLITPNPYQEVALNFLISGWVPKSWLDLTYPRIFIDILDVDGKTLMGGVIEIKMNWLSKFKKEIWFSDIFDISNISSSFFLKSRGRIVIELTGYHENQSFFLPVIMQEFEPDNIVDPEIRLKHKVVGEKVSRYNEELKIYNQKLKKITEDNIHKISANQSNAPNIQLNITEKNVSQDILNELRTSHEFNITTYDCGKENEEKSALNDEYKEALEWQGPFAAGGIDFLHIVDYSVVIILTWILRHIASDIDDGLWNKFKEVFRKVFVSIKKDIPNKEVALIVKNEYNEGIIFIFEISLSIEEFMSALNKVNSTLKSIDLSELSKNSIKPLIFKFNNTTKEWNEDNKYV